MTIAAFKIKFSIVKIHNFHNVFRLGELYGQISLAEYNSAGFLLWLHLYRQLSNLIFDI